MAPILKRTSSPDAASTTVGVVMAHHHKRILSINLTVQQRATTQTAPEQFAVTDLATDTDLQPAGGGGGGGTIGQPPVSYSRFIWNYHANHLPELVRLRSLTGSIDLRVDLAPATEQSNLQLDVVDPSLVPTQQAHQLLNTQAALGSIPEHVVALNQPPVMLGEVSASPFAIERWTDSNRLWFHVPAEQGPQAEHLFDNPRSDLGILLNGKRGIQTVGQQGSAGTFLSLIYP